MPTGAFYGARKANEPIHILYNYGEHAIEVINNKINKTAHLSAVVNILDFNMHRVLQRKIDIPKLNGQEAKRVFEIHNNLNLTKTWFMDLKLYDQQHQMISSNFYALSTRKDELDESKTTWFTTPQSQYANLKMLEQLPDIALQMKQTSRNEGDTTFVDVALKNTTDYLAFMVHLDLKSDESHESVVPVFWDDNYISLL